MTNLDYTHLSLILDRSGSMAMIRDDMEGGIKTLLKDQSSLPGKLQVDVTLFDSRVETPYVGALADEITEDLIIPRGSTALFDAVGVAVTNLGERLAAMEESERPGKVIVVIVTDGQENASREWTASSVKELVTKQTDEFQWEFLFLGANIDSASVGGGFGVDARMTMNYTPDAGGVQSMTRSMSSYVTHSRANTATDLQDEAPVDAPDSN